jgi:hypothetical protein
MISICSITIIDIETIDCQGYKFGVENGSCALMPNFYQRNCAEREALVLIRPGYHLRPPPGIQIKRDTATVA